MARSEHSAPGAITTEDWKYFFVKTDLPTPRPTTKEILPFAFHHEDDGAKPLPYFWSVGQERWGFLSGIRSYTVEEFTWAIALDQLKERLP